MYRIHRVHLFYALTVLPLTWGVSACAAPTATTPQTASSTSSVSATLLTLPPTAASYQKLAMDMNDNLQRQVLSKWFPTAIDKQHGGFFQNYGEDWTPGAANEKSIVYQSRLTWVAAQIALRYPEQAEAYRSYSRQGLDLLANVMWDQKQGGFYWEVNADGLPNTDRGAEKHVYGNAFGIYAATTNYRATHDPRALKLAQQAFAWLEKHAHDEKNGGYYEALTDAGDPILQTPTGPNAPTGDAIGTRYGYKSMNTHIHLLEAFTALYEVWPDKLLRTRFDEVFHLVRDKIVVEPGCQNLYFTPDWRAIPDHDSYGHDVETAYLLTEASAALGKPDDARIWTIARQIVDHALDYGWDSEYGGFYDAGGTFSKPTATEKIWWVQAEGLNALLLMHEHFENSTPKYWQAFLKQWDFISRYQVDAKYGGWYSTVSREGVATPGRVKSDRWTEAYHQSRALLNVSAALGRLAEGKKAAH